MAVFTPLACCFSKWCGSLPSVASSKGRAQLPSGNVVENPQEIIFEVADGISVQCHNLVWMLSSFDCIYSI